MNRAIFLTILDSVAEFDRWKLQSWGLIAAAYDVEAVWYVEDLVGDAELGTVTFHEQYVEAKRVESLEAALDDAKDLATVFVDGPRQVVPDSTRLAAFQHPAQAIYVFGGDRGIGIPHGFHRRPGARWVHLPARRGVYGFLAAAAVAASRFAFLTR